MWCRRCGAVIEATRPGLGGSATCWPNVIVCVVLVWDVIATRTATSCVKSSSSVVVISAATTEATATVAIESFGRVAGWPVGWSMARERPTTPSITTAIVRDWVISIGLMLMVVAWWAGVTSVTTATVTTATTIKGYCHWYSIHTATATRCWQCLLPLDTFSTQATVLMVTF